MKCDYHLTSGNLSNHMTSYWEKRENKTQKVILEQCALLSGSPIPRGPWNYLKGLQIYELIKHSLLTESVNGVGNKKWLPFCLSSVEQNRKEHTSFF